MPPQQPGLQLEGNPGVTDVLPSQFANLFWSEKASLKPEYRIPSVGLVCPWNSQLRRGVPAQAYPSAVMI